MEKAPESRVVIGLNDYRFVASLHVRHPSITPDEITAVLSLEPKGIKRKGEQRQSPTGNPLAGCNPENHWRAELTPSPGQDVSEFLLGFIDEMSSESIQLTTQIESSGGSVMVFIGLFAKSCCDFEVPAATLRRLGNAGIAVRLDYYHD
jgi:hypothetical protein